MSVLLSACFSLLLVSLTLEGVAGLTNLEFFDLVKDYVSDVEIVDNYVTEANGEDNDVISLPGGPNDEIDLLYLFDQLGFAISEVYPGEAPYGAVQDTEAEPLLGGCSCSGTTCSCCGSKKFEFKVFFKKVKFTLSGCLEVKYLTHNKGFNIKLTVNGHTLYNKEISLANPPAICYPVPSLPFVKLCLRLYNIDYPNKKACAKLEGVASIKIKKFTVSFDLGCFHIPIEDREDHIRLRIIQLLAEKYGLAGEPEAETY